MRLPASNGDMSKGILLLLFDDIAESSHGVNRLAFTGAGELRRSEDLRAPDRFQ